MSKSTIFEMEVNKSNKEVADFVKEISSQLEGDRVFIRHEGSDFIAPGPFNDIKLEFTYKRKPKKSGIRHKLEIEITWIEEKQSDQEDLTAHEPIIAPS